MPYLDGQQSVLQNTVHVRSYTGYEPSNPGRMIKQPESEATAFIAWSDPSHTATVLFAPIETICMVASRALRDEEMSLHSLHTRFLIVESFGVFDVDQAYLPGNSTISINDVGKKTDSYDNDMSRQCQRQADVQGRIRTAEHNQLYAKRTAALKEASEDPVCPGGKPLGHPQDQYQGIQQASETAHLRPM